MKLLYFTSSYPYGLGEQWKANELNVLVDYFDEITVIPHSYSGNATNPKPLPAGVKLTGTVVNDGPFKVSKWHFFQIIFHKKAAIFFKEFFRKKVYRKRIWLMSWLISSIDAIRMLNSKVIQEVLAGAGSETCLYFYWGKGTCQVLPFIETSRFHKIFVRMHHYDLFEYENNGYIPFRGPLLDAISIAAPSSIAGKIELENHYPQTKAKKEVVRCGTVGNNRLAAASQDKVLRIVSCSLLSPIKRVHLMIESMEHLDMPVLWRHVGDGVLRHELEMLVQERGLTGKFIFEGMIDSRKVLDFYTANTFDLFINTSAGEGVPFSIMEAFSTSIPVMATDVGGSAEIAGADTGALLPAALTPQVLAVAIKKFYLLSTEEKNILRNNALSSYRRSWDAHKLARELADILKN